MLKISKDEILNVQVLEVGSKNPREVKKKVDSIHSKKQQREEVILALIKVILTLLLKKICFILDKIDRMDVFY